MPISKRTSDTCLMTSGGLPLVIVVWSTAPWCTLKMFLAVGERIKLLLIGFVVLLSVATEGVRLECPGAVGAVERGVVTSGFVVGGYTFIEGEVTPLIVLVDALRGTSRDEGVGCVFSVMGCSSSGTFPLLFVRNQSITFFALLVLAALPTPGLATSGNLLSRCWRGGKTAVFGGSWFTSESDGSRDLSPAGPSFDDGPRGVPRPDFVRCLIVLENGSTMTVNVFLRFFFDDVALALELLTGLNS